MTYDQWLIILHGAAGVLTGAVFMYAVYSVITK